MGFIIRKSTIYGSIGLTFGAMLFFFAFELGQGHPIIQKVHVVETKIEKEWVIPARFNGQGAFTIGCRYFDTASLTPYSEENPNSQLAGLDLDFTGELQAILDGPDGTVAVSARECGISADWRAIPLHSRPGDATEHQP